LTPRREQTGLYSHHSKVVMVYHHNILVGLYRAEYEVYIALLDSMVFSLDYKMLHGLAPKYTVIIHVRSGPVYTKVVK
jgi:hypothetical protein